MTPREKISALLERSACCRVDGELGECKPEPAICGPCWTGGDHRTCEHRVYSPSLQTVQDLTPVWLGLLELWAAGVVVAQAYRALEATYWMGEETEDTSPAAEAMDAAFRAFAARLKALDARAAEALGEGAR